MSLSGAVLSASAIAVILASGAGVAWSLFIRGEDRARTREHEVRSAASLIATAAEAFLAAGDTESLSRLAAGAASSFQLESCEFRLPRGAVLADSTGQVRRALELPEQGSPPVAPEESRSGGAMVVTLPIRVPERGDVALVVTGRVAAAYWDPSLARLGGGVALVFGLLALAGMQRVLGPRLKGLSAVGDALAIAGGGETDPGVLGVEERLGPAATSWNSLVAEREALRRFAAFKESAEHGRGGGAGADLAAACDAMPQGLLLLDDKLKVRFANGAAAALLACKREDLSGQDLRKRIADPEVIAAIESVASGRVRQRVAVETSKVGPTARSSEQGEEGGASVLRFTSKPIRRDEHGGLMLVIEDVTQQKVAESARSEFVAQATHELRTPLTNIRLYVDSMLENSNDAEARVRALNVVSSESRRLERIVDDMLSMSEIEAGTLKIARGDVRLDQLFAELEADYRALAEDKELSFALEMPSKLPVLQGDRDKLALTLHNLVGNAMKYTPAGGGVVVRVEDVGTRLLIHVVDNGIGIRKEEQDLVFDKFYRARDKRVSSVTGTGLGLTLARDIARLHGGDITLQSELDKGSTFTLELPILPGQSAKAAA